LELYPAYGTTAILIGTFVVYVASRKFDPFAPIWMFFVGYTQIYVFQAINYHEWAVRVRGTDMVMTANFRACWALIWFLVAYHSGIPKLVAARLPAPPVQWSPAIISAISPPLTLWGLLSAGLLLRSASAEVSAERAIIGSFPFVLLVSAVLLIVTGRAGGRSRPLFTTMGVMVGVAYVFIWMFNGKRSHSLMGVMATICAFYISRVKRPSWPVLFMTGFLGVLAVSIAIAWRFDQQRNPNQTAARFVQFLTEFDPNTMLRNMNIEDDSAAESHETEEYGAYLVMLTAVPAMAEYDHGASYLRTFSTFIPRIIWPSKPYYGRQEWVNAWIAGSEFKREADFTGPAIGLLGATQLNGGAWGTFIVVGVLALFVRGCYDYFSLYAHVTWIQAWWALFFFNVWFMVVTDDPMVWFYYNWGFTTFPFLVMLWFLNRGTRATRYVGNTPQVAWTSQTAG